MALDYVNCREKGQLQKLHYLSEFLAWQEFVGGISLPLKKVGSGVWGVIWSCPLNRFQNMKNIQIFFSFRVFSTKCVLIQIFVKQKNYKSKGKKYSAIPVLKYNVITLVKIHDSVFDTRKKYDIQNRTKFYHYYLLGQTSIIKTSKIKKYTEYILVLLNKGENQNSNSTGFFGQFPPSK